MYPVVLLKDYEIQLWPKVIAEGLFVQYLIHTEWPGQNYQAKGAKTTNIQIIF